MQEPLKKQFEINEKHFNELVIKSEKPVLLMFWGSWCPVCKQAEPMLKEILNENNNFSIKKMNVDRNPHIATKYEVMGTPNFCLFKKGKLINRRVGSQSKQQIIQMIEEKI